MTLDQLELQITTACRSIDQALDRGDRRSFSEWTQRLADLTRQRADLLAALIRAAA